MSKIYANQGEYVRDNLFNGAPTPTMVDRWAQMKELSDTTITKMILGELDPIADFDSYINDWNKMGGDKVVEEVNAWYRVNAK
jgi:putative aldouronate transport system substrate-binding protein